MMESKITCKNYFSCITLLNDLNSNIIEFYEHVYRTEVSSNSECIFYRNGKIHSLTADIAIRFSKYFGNSADFWLGIQNEYDLREEFEKHKKDFESIKKLKAAV
jgi:hypothetical protein